MKRLYWSTNCEWCMTETNGDKYCARCERLRCEHCGCVYKETEMEACEHCRKGYLRWEDWMEKYECND